VTIFATLKLQHHRVFGYLWNPWSKWLRPRLPRIWLFYANWTATATSGRK